MLLRPSRERHKALCKRLDVSLLLLNVVVINAVVDLSLGLVWVRIVED